MFTQKDLIAIEQFRRAVQLFAESLSYAKAREVPTIYRKWEPDTDYTTGQYLTKGTDSNGDPLLYEVLQNHTSQEDWAPEDAPALYKCFSLSKEGYPVWAQPTGEHDAYNKGDIVEKDGLLYRSNIDGNTTEPGTDDRWWSRYEEA